MDPALSWAIFIIVIGALWYLNKREKAPVVKKIDAPPEKAKAIFVSTAGSGNDTSDAKKKKKKTKKSAAPAVVPKEVISSANQSDDDVAEEVDLREVARRVKNQSASLKPSATRNYAASQTSADGDISDEDFTAHKGSSTDPSDMLESSTSGPGVLRIGAPTQLPRGQKQKKASSTTEPGLHAAKNAKKKEKKKAERAEERALQQARLEAHRKAQRAEEAKEAKQPVVAAPATSAWTEVSGKKSPAPKTVTPPSELLDTFTPVDSADETVAASTTLGDSWESIPRGLQVPEPEWNEVKSKKGRKDRKADDSDVPKSSDERETASKAKAVAPAPEFTKPAPPPPAPKLSVQKKNTASTNNFAALDSRTASGSDWTNVEDNIENWVAHPESSDY